MTIVVGGSSGITLPTWTTSTRPALPVAGQIGYNSTLTKLEYYNGSAWVASGDVGLAATGGTKTGYFSEGTLYYVHTFTTSGTFAVTSGSGTANYLVVAGGGGGGGAGAYNGGDAPGPSSGGNGGGGGGVGTVSGTGGAGTINRGGGGGGANSGTGGAGGSGVVIISYATSL